MAMSVKDDMWQADWKNDVVYLHVLPREMAGPVVNISPFALKLELWMRINKIPFEVVDYDGWSSKGKSPFMLFNGKEYPDSNLITDFLVDYFKTDPYPGCSESDKAVGRAFHKMLEENTIWSIFIYRYVEHVEEYAKYFMTTKPMEARMKRLNYIKQKLPEQANSQGIGRHSSEEIHRIGCDDIRAVSDFLGTKNFMLGDQPTLVDCALFGVASQFVCVPVKYPERSLVEQECSNIRDFVERIKANYWPDWDSQCSM